MRPGIGVAWRRSVIVLTSGDGTLRLEEASLGLIGGVAFAKEPDPGDTSVAWEARGPGDTLAAQAARGPGLSDLEVKRTDSRLSGGWAGGQEAKRTDCMEFTHILRGLVVRIVAVAVR